MIITEKKWHTRLRKGRLQFTSQEPGTEDETDLRLDECCKRTWIEKGLIGSKDNLTAWMCIHWVSTQVFVRSHSLQICDSMTQPT